MDLLEKFRKAKCCISERPLSDCEYVNMMQTDYLATWDYPYVSNVLLRNDYKHAVAYVHDDYAPRPGAEIPPLKFVIEIQGDNIIYHPVETLQKGPSRLQFVKQTGQRINDLQKATIRSKFYTTELKFGPDGVPNVPISAELLQETLQSADVGFRDSPDGTEIVIFIDTEDQKAVAVFLMGRIMGEIMRQSSAQN